MPLWVFAALAAATAQTLRFVMQRHLARTGLSATGATYTRFVFAAPVVVGIVLAYAALSGQGVAVPARLFWAYAVVGGTAQILATILTVSLFSMRNFAVGVALAKTEVLLSAGIGALLLQDMLGPLAVALLALGALGVALMSARGAARFDGRVALFGIGAGLLFALSGVCYRGASLTLGSGDAFLRAAQTLACVTSFQAIAMTLVLRWRDPGQISASLRRWRVAAVVAGASLLGSLGWFTAFTLQNVALVKAVGNVEVVLSLLVSVLFFAERISAREVAGIALVLGSAVAVTLI